MTSVSIFCESRRSTRVSVIMSIEVEAAEKIPANDWAELEAVKAVR